MKIVSRVVANCPTTEPPKVYKGKEKNSQNGKFCGFFRCSLWFQVRFMSRSRTQGRYWILTIPKDDWEPCLPEGVKYCIGQGEIGETTGYSHWQLLAIFTEKVGLRGCKRAFTDTAHCELSRSEASEDYCTKEETRIVGTEFCFGEKPFKRNSKPDWDKIWELAKSGSILDVPANIRIQNYRTLVQIGSDFASPSAVEREVVCYWGPTGSGKSRRAWDEAGFDAYCKDPRTKFWCGYRGQQRVVMDEFRGGIDISHLLRWFDRYPVNVEIKGSSCPLAAKEIWITSNLPPSSWYPLLDEPTLAALERRLKVIHME